MADTTKSSSQSSFCNKSALPPSGGNDGNGARKVPEGTPPKSDTAGVKSKPKVRPPKLKTPLNMVMSEDLSGGHRPIGTPPPTSLRRSSGLLDEPPFTLSDAFHSFPQISVESLEGSETGNEEEEDDAAAGSAFPALTPSPSSSSGTMEPPDNQRGRINSENNNQEANPRESPTSTGLTPPQRLITRDQDGVVFELTSQELQTKHSTTLGPTTKTTRLDPIIK